MVGGYAALCHIGDSRAYLLRDGQFVQVTRDHTLVQSLIDEGTITEDDVPRNRTGRCCSARWTAGRSPSLT